MATPRSGVGGAAEPVSALELAARLGGRDSELAAQHARNGTPWIGRSLAVRSWLEADPLPPMPLGAVDRCAPSQPGRVADRRHSWRPAAICPRCRRIRGRRGWTIWTRSIWPPRRASRSSSSAPSSPRSLRTSAPRRCWRRRWIARRGAALDGGPPDLVARLEYFLGWSARSRSGRGGPRKGSRTRCASSGRSVRRRRRCWWSSSSPSRTAEADRAQALVAEVDAIGTAVQRARARARALVGYRDKDGEPARQALAAEGLALLGPVSLADEHGDGRSRPGSASTGSASRRRTVPPRRRARCWTCSRRASTRTSPSRP